MNLHFLWRENYIDYLWASSVTAHAYFLHSGIILYENGVLNAYASSRELKEVRAITARLMKNPEGIVQMQTDFDAMRKSTKGMASHYTKSNIRKNTNKELYKLFLELLHALRKGVMMYRYIEPHFVTPIEQMLFDAVGHKLPQYQKQEKAVSRLLSNKDPALPKKYGISKVETRLFDLVRQVAKMRFEAKKTSFPLDEFAEILLREAARRTYLAVSQVSSLELQELKNLLIEGREPDLESVNRRQKRFALKVIMSHDPSVKTLSDNQVEKLIAYDRNHSNNSFLRGTIAYPGKVTGNAKVIPALFGAEEYRNYIRTLRKNDILIATMTTPRLAQAFSKIAAVVTDEGGLMSHAALLAREKSIPCIIGTKIATRVLKNGDRITVDANNGIITKYSK